jgi:hypothetical protein
LGGFVRCILCVNEIRVHIIPEEGSLRYLFLIIVPD